MIANSQWSSCYQQHCKDFLRQLDCSCFGYGSSGLAGTLLIDLGIDLKRVENTCERDDLNLYVDLPFYPLEDTEHLKVQNEIRDDALSMEAGETSAVNQSVGPVSLNSDLVSRHQRRMSDDTLTCVHGGNSTSSKTEYKSALLGSGQYHLGPDDMDTESGNRCLGPDGTVKVPVFEEKPHKVMVLGSYRVANLSDQGFVEERENHQLNRMPRSSNKVTLKLLEKSDEKRLGKRTCSVSEPENSKRRKVTVSSVKDEYQSPWMENSARTSIHLPREASKAKIVTGVETRSDALLDVKSGGPNVLYRSQPSSILEDINKEEADLELQQCVSLLKKYGVLKSRDFYLSQNLPGCVPHPGSVGEALQSTVCKTCGAPEDASGTVICDECQEAFHLSCCLPRMSLKYFDKEDDWYCNSCKKQKKKIGSKVSTESCSSQGNLNLFKSTQIGSSNSSETLFPVEVGYNSRVRLGRAHQADVPLWTGKIDDNDQEPLATELPGTEVPMSQEEKNAEKDCILKTFQNKTESLDWRPAKMLPHGMLENWLQCQCVMERAFKDSDGQKHSEVICGKWRRAPLNVEQTDSWECFCATEWDPLHADCAVAQEVSTEEILKRICEKLEDQVSEIHVGRQLS